MKCESFQTGYSTLLLPRRGARVIFAGNCVGGALRWELRGDGPHVRDGIALLEARLLRGRRRFGAVLRRWGRQVMARGEGRQGYAGDACSLRQAGGTGEGERAQALERGVGTEVLRAAQAAGDTLTEDHAGG